MSSETFTTAMFLIAAIISAGVLINAIFPVIYTLSGTITSSSHNVDERLSTDVRIVTTYASGGNDTARVWIKNVGTARISEGNIPLADVFIGTPGNFILLGLAPSGTHTWTYTIHEVTTNNCWDPGETLCIDITSDKIPSKGEAVYFQFVLPSGLSRSITFTAGD